MKKLALVIFLGVLSVGLLFNLSWAVCSEDTVDLGACDTLHVVPFPTTDTCIIYAYHFTDEPESDYTDTICINNPGEKFPCFMYVNLLVTHDSNSFYWQGCNEGAGCWTRDSIAAMIVPLGWTRTNPAKYCSLTTYWNENTVDTDAEPPGVYPRRIWRNFPRLNGDSTNLMDKLKWATMIVELSSDSVLADGTPPHAFISLLAQTKRKWRQQTDTLLATLTFRIEDTMHVCIDTTFWPPGSHLQFIRLDAQPYMPRTNLPLCIWAGPPQIQVLSPNGGDTLCVGNTKDITWLSEKLTDPVKIEYSTNGGQSWIVIVGSTPNTGVYHWPNVPNTPSTNCLVKISAAVGGVPSDSSDAPFTISGETIIVTYPNGGEIFVAGDSLSVTWNSACFTGSVNILMSEDGGAHWNPIASGTENDGIYPTSISQSVSTNQGLIKVSDSVDGIPSDQSEGFFTVRNFSIRAKPETLVVSAGKDTSCKVILESQFGFNLPCTLTVSEDSLPAHTTYDLDTRTVAPTDTAILTFHTESSAPSCTSHVIVTGAKISGTKNQLEHSTKVILIVTGPPPDFSIDASPDILFVPRGYSGDYKVILMSINGFASNCTLTVAGYPGGSTTTFNPPAIAPTDSSILTIAIPDTLTFKPCPCYSGEPCPPCTSHNYTLTITAAEMEKDKGITHSKDVMLVVTLLTWDFGIKAFPDTQIVMQGNSTTYGVTIFPKVGFTAPCTLFVEGLPNGATADFDSNPIPPNDTSTLTITTLLLTPPDTYGLAIIAVANKKQKDTTYVKLIVEQKTGVNGENDQLISNEYVLFQNYPNPFNASTTIEFSIPECAHVGLEIFNILGQRVKTLVDQKLDRGRYSVNWNAEMDLPSGPYFYRLMAGRAVKIEKMILLK